MPNRQKQAINLYSRRKQFLIELTALKEMAENADVGEAFLPRIISVEKGVQSINFYKRDSKTLLKDNKKLIDEIKRELTYIADKKSKKLSLTRYFLSFSWFAILAIFSLSSYFHAIPNEYFKKYILFYILSAILLSMIWTIIFFFIIKARDALFVRYGLPYIAKYPRRKFMIISATSIHTVTVASQLLTASVTILPKFINPSWELFIANIYNILISTVNSSPITAIASVIGISPVIGYIITFTSKKLKKHL